MSAAGPKVIKLQALLDAKGRAPRPDSFSNAQEAPMEKLGMLQEVNLREAWPDEALHFTPWLADNLHVLGKVLGIELELVEAEAGVQEFWADILARNPKDDRKVLIENQLEKSDHTHLGQILTYLAGLEASTIVWVAKDFSDAHLSAVSWLNENTK